MRLMWLGSLVAVPRPPPAPHPETQQTASAQGENLSQDSFLEHVKLYTLWRLQ